MTQLYLITGFLGAGKTTFLNKIFLVFKGQRTFVIVNEFGKVGVDGDIVREKGYDVFEISEGSIFCVCKNDRFMEALSEAYKRQSQVLLVETSGLSDPAGMDEVLENMKKIYDEDFDYRGCICLIDAKNFKKVVNTAVVVPSQVKEASLVVINKIDLVGCEEINEIKKQIAELNPKCDIVLTAYAEIPPEKIKRLQPVKNLVLNHRVDIFSSSVTVRFSSAVRLCDVKKFLEKISPSVYRCKGYFCPRTRDEREGTGYYIDGVMDDIKCSEILTGNHESVLVILYNIRSKLREMVNEFCEISGSVIL